MKRLAMFLTLSLLVPAAFPLAQRSALPDEARFDEPVTFSTGREGESLAVMVSALARSIGLTPVVDDVPEVLTFYDIGEPKPFRQVWDLVMTLNGLDYVLQDNDVVIVGPPEALATLRVRTGLDPADAGERPAYEQRVYRLSNAIASDLAGVLRESDLARAAMNDGTGASAEFAVIADPRTNSLIITATRPIQERIAELVPQLDTAQPQISVNIRIQEVNRSVINDFGVDLSAAGGSFATTLLEGGLAFVFDAQRAISQLNLSAVLDSLERQNLSRRVDDTNLTVLNNETASLDSGGTLTIVRQVETNEGTQLQPLELEYGVNVEVTPRISADGRITLTVRAGVSDLIEYSPETVNLADQSIESVITIDPGQTILLGGLVESMFTSNRRSVPLLGDLPLIGSLFSRTELTQEDNELLLIVRADLID